MRFLPGFAVACAAAVALPLLLLAQTPHSASADIELQLGDLLMNEARFRDAQESYRRAVAAAAEDGAVGDGRRRVSSWRSCGRATSPTPTQKPTAWATDQPTDARGQSLYGDTLWAFGLFDEAEHAYAPRSDTTSAKPARITAARAASRRAADSPRHSSRHRKRCKLPRASAEFHHTVGFIYERRTATRRRRRPSATTSTCCPNKEHSEKALWSRAQIRFLRLVQGARADRHRRGAGAGCGQRAVRIETTRWSSRRGSTAAAASSSSSTPGPSRRSSRATSRRARRRPSDHLHAERRRRRRRIARAAGRPHRPARDRQV